jgi:hypothetical protein
MWARAVLFERDAKTPKFIEPPPFDAFTFEKWLAKRNARETQRHAQAIENERREKERLQYAAWLRSPEGQRDQRERAEAARQLQREAEARKAAEERERAAQVAADQKHCAELRAKRIAAANSDAQWRELIAESRTEQEQKDLEAPYLAWKSKHDDNP